MLHSEKKERTIFCPSVHCFQPVSPTYLTFYLASALNPSILMICTLTTVCSLPMAIYTTTTRPRAVFRIFRTSSGGSAKALPTSTRRSMENLRPSLQQLVRLTSSATWLLWVCMLPSKCYWPQTATFSICVLSFRTRS